MKIDRQKFPGYSKGARYICIRFRACNVSTSKGTEMKAGTSDMKTGELAAKIAKNATKLIAEKIIKAMQSIFKKEGSDE